MSGLRSAKEKQMGKKITLLTAVAVFGLNAVAGSGAMKWIDGRDVPLEGRPFGDKVLSKALGR